MTRMEVLALRQLIEQAVQSLPDAAALKGIRLYPLWGSGKEYAAGEKVQFDGRLWRCVQGHTSQSGWEPENVPALWEQICESHAGTADDPIPYEGNMALVQGLYYVQDGALYRCTRDTEIPVHHALAELVGLYVERC